VYPTILVCFVVGIAAVGCRSHAPSPVEIVLWGEGETPSEARGSSDQSADQSAETLEKESAGFTAQTGDAEETGVPEPVGTPARKISGRRWWWPWKKSVEPSTETPVSTSPQPSAPEEEREKALAEQLSAEQPGDWFAPDGSPYLRPGFSIKVSVIAGGILEVPEMVRTISDKGTITLPLVGRVECQGMTIRTLAERLTEEYSRFLKEPNVSVDYVYEGKPGEVSPWGWVSVYGAVNSPGRINIPPSRDLSLSRAIQFAGGLNRVARETDIRIWRRTPEGARRIVINLLDIAKRGMIEKDLTLEPGDIIFVPESVW